MKTHGQRILAFLLCAVILVGFAPKMHATTFQDLEGHWAKEALERAFEQGLVRGYPDALMKPDQAMDKAEVLAMLTRLIGAVPPGDLSATQLSPELWYYPVAEQAAGLKLLPSSQLSRLEEPISREETFVLVGKAFQLATPSQDTSILQAYQDAELLSYEARPSVSAMLEQGFLQGYNGMLAPKSSITRAEFVTILERMVGHYLLPEELTDEITGGVNLPSQLLGQISNDTLVTVSTKPSPDVSLSALRLHTNVLVNATARNLDLDDIQSDGTILLRCAKLEQLHMRGGSLRHLVIAAHEGDLSFTPERDGTVDIVTVGDGSGILRLGDGIQKVEVTGSDRTVYLEMAQLDSLIVSGSNNRVVVETSCQIDTISLLAAGEGNTLTVNGQADNLMVLGDHSLVDGSGKALEVLVLGLDCQFDLNCEALTQEPDYGLGQVSITLKASHKALPAGEVLSVTADFHGVQADSIVSAQWYQDGIPSKIYQNPNFPLNAAATSQFFPGIVYKEDMPASTTVGLALTYQRSDCLQRVYQEITVSLTNYPYEYYHPGPLATDKLIALTFDDGPCANTSGLLDTLAQRGVKVTFFISGSNVHYRPEVISRMIEEGHEVGSHTFNHPELTKQSAATVRNELDSTNAALFDAAGVASTLLRPPYGSYNQSVLNICKEKNLAVIHWSVDSEDWKSRNGDTILKRIFQNGSASAKDGDIILMHDTVPATTQIAGAIVDRLLAQGYHFVTVSELISLRYGSAPEPGKVYFYAR